MTEDVLDELERYLAGQLEGEMGMKSQLGTVLEYGTALGGPGGRTPPDPSTGALAAARTATRVEEVLVELSVEERAVLAAWYHPEPGLRTMGGERSIEAVSRVLVGEERLAVLARESRVGVRKGSDAHRAFTTTAEGRRILARVAQEGGLPDEHLAALPDDQRSQWNAILSQLRAAGLVARLLSAHVATAAGLADLGPDAEQAASGRARAAKDELKLVARRARMAVSRALDAYVAAEAMVRQRRRERRRERCRAGGVTGAG